MTMPPKSSVPPLPSLRPATDKDRAIAERLWLLFRHDMSEFHRQLPNPDGTYRDDRLQLAFTDPDWKAYLLIFDDRPVGLAIVRGLMSETRVLNSFFVVRPMRRRGAGLHVVRELLALYPGRWEVAFQDSNLAAVHFWRKVATMASGDHWSEERRPVPGKPELPRDVWISFDTRTL